LINYQDGTSICKSISVNHNDINEELGKTTKVADSSEKLTSPKFKTSTHPNRSFTEHIELWYFGKTLNERNQPVRNLVQEPELEKHAHEISQVKVKSEMVYHDKLAPVIPVIEAKMEVSTETEAAALREKTLPYNCKTCFRPARTRCAQCKSVHYW
jgi:hypothetical protein